MTGELDQKVLYIGGFGRIFWIEPGELVPPASR